MNTRILFYIHVACLLLLTIPTTAQEFDGYALYNSLNSNTTYLIDREGDIAHTWSMDRPCNYAVLLMESGNIIRGAVNLNNDIMGPAVGGLVQEIDPDGNVVWEFVYSSADYVAHHDISLMPDGNVLLTAWEVKSSSELQAMGYTGNENEKFPTHFIEVSQNGTGGEIVWEWHIWDHMIQDVDPNKPNYGVIADHPELMDINVSTGGGGGPGGGSGDWFHVNGVDYNAALDQIVFSSRLLSEVMIIDHSTTTAEAAGHSGGNSGKGGDILYRWGNPSNFEASGSQTIFGAVHDARWIPDDGRPRGGFIQFFNNEGDGISSTTDALELPFASDGYNYDWTPGQSYAPSEPTWRHTCLDNADGQSAAYSLPNGNTFVNLSGEYMYEVDLDDNVVWQYNAGPAKAFRYVCADPGIQALISQEAIEDICSDIINSAIEVESGQINIFPNPSADIFMIEGASLELDIKDIQVLDMMGRQIPVQAQGNMVNLVDYPSGVYFISIVLGDNQRINKKVFLVNH